MPVGASTAMLGSNLSALVTMTLLAQTPPPPYYAVIFSSVRTDDDEPGYAAAAQRMMELAASQPGFLGVDSARAEMGVTVSYWTSLEAIKRWRNHAEHQQARQQGRAQWYAAFRVRIARVERDYGWPESPGQPNRRA
ncbi:MAG: antibiotic biosynthesis monooxygenase [Abyssibacter sp.]|uniref:antibiotic biosynthesis monooxygenase family protein n=1 Tax=Abyssibacter sp. TaxID=2320200 RepID=UPI0032191213